MENTLDSAARLSSTNYTLFSERAHRVAFEMCNGEIEMGAVVDLFPQTGSRRYKSRFVGSTAEGAILMAVDGEDLDGLVCESGNKLSCRHFSGNSFILFESNIIDIGSVPIPIISLSRPSGFQYIDARRGARFEISRRKLLVKQAEKNEGYSAALFVNVGLGGASIDTSAPLGLVGDRVVTRFGDDFGPEVGDGLEIVGCIKHLEMMVHRDIRKFRYNLQFDAMTKIDVCRLKAILFDMTTNTRRSRINSETGDLRNDGITNIGDAVKMVAGENASV